LVIVRTRTLPCPLNLFSSSKRGLVMFSRLFLYSLDFSVAPPIFSWSLPFSINKNVPYEWTPSGSRVFLMNFAEISMLILEISGWFCPIWLFHSCFFPCWLSSWYPPTSQTPRPSASSDTISYPPLPFQLPPTHAAPSSKCN
jgi:hypothetical protein